MDLISLSHIPYFYPLAYVVLFIGMMLDAMVFLLAGVFLMAQGYLNPALTLAVIFFGAWAEQVFLYYIGHHLSKSSWVRHWADKIAQRFDHHITEKPFRTFALSKYIYGLHRAVLVRAGMLKMDIKVFIKNSFPGTAIWVAVFSIIAYSVSASYSVLKKYISYAELVPLVVLIVIFIVEYFISRRLKSEL